MKLSLFVTACLLFFAAPLFAQKGKVITGHITSAQNNPLENDLY